VSKWVVNIFGKPNEEGFEISVVRLSNQHGRTSYGWFGHDKVYISGDSYTSLSSALWNSLVNLAQQTADVLNAQDAQAVAVQDEKPFPSHRTCLYCENFRYPDDEIIDPTTAHQPHLAGICKNCPYPDAYGIPCTSGSIWVNLVTHDTWVDGSHQVTDCPNFVQNPLVFGYPEPVEIFNEIPLPRV